MKRKIEQLINGKFDYETPPLILSRKSIEVQVVPGESCQGELYLGTEKDWKLKGYVNSSSRRFIPSVEQFSGTAVQISYGIDTSGMECGQVCKGVLSLMTNVGEYEIPFSIEAQKEQVRTSTGEVADLDAFVELAKNNYREAFRLFTKPSFMSLIGEDEKLLALYKGMSHNPVTYQHLEEFLIGAGQKEAVHISLKEEETEHYEVMESVKESMEIHKSGWGHLRLEVEVQGDFIQIQKRVISEDEFIGSVYQLEYVILRHKLGKGRKTGRIIVRGPYGTLFYTITASRNSNIQVNMNTFEKQRKAGLFRDYMDLRLHKIDFKTWQERSLGVLENMAEAGCDYPIYQIYEAYIRQMDDEEEKAREILLKYQDKSFTREDRELAGAYLYVCCQAGLLSDELTVADKVRRLYQQQEDSFLLLWILMQVDEELKGSVSRAAHMMEQQYQIGCRSPLLYLETFRLVQKDINLLTRVNEFWTQVMCFGAKEGFLTEEISMRIAYLSGYEKVFNESLYKTLTMAYEQFPSNDTLEAICKMIMKDNPGKKKYFPWFELAVEQGLRLTRLYECYIETIDDRYQKLLPKTIRMYFAYNNPLSDRKKAFIYANVVRHKDEDPQSYENYKKTIHDFAYQKLQEGVMNEDYAVLYQEFSRSINSEEEVEALSRVIFTNRLYCDDKKIRNVIVCYSQMEEEEIYPCRAGVAYPRIYTDDGVILFQDGQQRRYAATVDYNLRKLFDDEVIERCSHVKKMEPGFLLNRCSRQVSSGVVTEETMAAHQQLAQSPEFTREYRRKIRRRLLTYYGENAHTDQVEDYLRNLDYVEYANVDKKQLMELLISRGMLNEAYIVLCEFGSEGVSKESLLKLCSRIILKYEFEEEDELLCLAAEVFQMGIYDEVVLHYLMLYYLGPVEEMIKLWNSARGFQMDTYRLEEKVLTQMVFVGECREFGARLLESYVKQRGQESVILGYITFCAYEYFIRHIPMMPYVEKCLEAAYQREWNLGMVCKLALLKLLAAKRDWTAQQDQEIHSLLEDCYRRRLYFAFFQKLPRELLAPYQLDDKVFVEYQGAPAKKVVLHYALDTGLGNELEYRSEPLKNIYQGYYVKTFTLFYGESLHYYFTVEDGESDKTPEKVLTATGLEKDPQTRYQMINQMLSARKLGKTEAVKEKITEYQQQERFVEQLFSIEKEQCHE